MQERSVTSGQHRKRFSVLLGIFIAFAAVVPAGMPPAPEGDTRDATQLPAALRNWNPANPPPPTEALKALKQAVDCFNDKRYASALDALPDERNAKATVIGDYILLYRAKSRLMMERNKEALDDFRLLESRYPDSPLRNDAVLGQCQASLQLKDPKSALAVLNSRKIDADSETLLCQAKALDEAGEKNSAVALYLQIYSKYPASESATPAERHLLSLSPGALKGTRNYGIRLQRAENLLRANNARDARALLLALGRVSAPDSGLSQKRHLLMAEAEYRLGKTWPALTHLQKVTNADPALHARAISLEGACRRRQGREQSLLALRDKALKLYPLSQDTEELCFSAASYFDMKYEFAKARDAYRVLNRTFPKGRYAEAALWKLSMASYFDKRYGEAALGFYNSILAYPSPLSAGSAMYWMGRCYDRLGESGKARYLYGRAQALANNSYYGQRAREAEASLQEPADIGSSPGSGLDFKQVVAACDAIRLAPFQLSEPDNNGIRIMERARQLAAAGLSDLALSELHWGIRRHPQNEDALGYILAQIYASRGDHYEAISGLRRIFPDYSGQPTAAFPREVWQLLYPVRYWEAISAQAARTRTDPLLILGVIRQESAFEEKARSRSNARGLMQILPSTGRQLSKQARIPRYNANRLYDPEISITLGTRFLASLLQQYERTEVALAAYNAGKSRADRWLREFGTEDMAEFVERIPIYETRNYVKQILSNRAHYGLLFRDSDSATR